MGEGWMGKGWVWSSQNLLERMRKVKNCEAWRVKCEAWGEIVLTWKLQYNKIESLPTEIGHLKILSSVNVHFLSFTFPFSSSFIPSLNLFFSSFFFFLPSSSLISYPSLMYLSHSFFVYWHSLFVSLLFQLDNNMLTTIPTEIGEVTNLGSFSVRNNALKTLPSEFGNLTQNLHTLDVRTLCFPPLPLFTLHPSPHLPSFTTSCPFL